MRLYFLASTEFERAVFERVENSLSQFLFMPLTEEIAFQVKLLLSAAMALELQEVRHTASARSFPRHCPQCDAPAEIGGARYSCGAILRYAESSGISIPFLLHP